MYLLVLLLTFVDTSANPPKSKNFVSHYENVMGTSFEMKLLTNSEKKADKAERIALAEIARLSSILSSYDPNSEFSRWLNTQNQPTKVSSELIEVISLFEKWNIKTHGAINPAFASINILWKNAAKFQQIPSREKLDQAIVDAAQQHWLIDYQLSTITHLSKSPLLINTFVKSYIMDRVVKKVKDETAIDQVLINIGGDVITSGDQEETIHITDPRASAINDAPLAIVKLNNKFVATSGDYRRGYLINNHWYSHIIDPRTAQPAADIISATVIYDNATDAGAMATAFNILSFTEIEALAEEFPGLAYLVVDKNGQQFKNSNWKAIEQEQHSFNNDKNVLAKDDLWDPAYELVVNLELAKIQGPSRRPFVAIWIEDKDKNSVRTVTVWFNKPRWLRDLRAWYRANNTKFNAESGSIRTVSSATRSAGAYEIKWDGKDDGGELVKKGTYTVYIEVAREHGTYQLISQELKVNNKTTKIELPSNVEVASASLEVKKK